MYQMITLCDDIKQKRRLLSVVQARFAPSRSDLRCFVEKDTLRLGRTVKKPPRIFGDRRKPSGMYNSISFMHHTRHKEHRP